MTLFSCIEPYDNIPQECSSEKYKTTMILRILSGSIDLKNNLTQEIANLKNCYIDSLSHYKRMKRAKLIFKSFDGAIGLKDYSSFVNDFQFRNVSFFSKILEEIEAFSWFTIKRHHTSAFVYIYRILEQISVSFPLIYVSSAKDFSKSFDLLKSYFNRGTADYKSELKFFNHFLKLAFEKSTCFEQSYKFSFFGDDVVREAFYKVFKINYLHEFVINEDENSFVEVKWGGYWNYNNKH